MKSGLNILIGPNSDIRRLKLAIRVFMVMLMFCAQTYTLHAQLQSQHSSVRIVEIYGSSPAILPSMGGSGVSYLSGVSGLRINPANVQFNSEKKWTVKLGLFSMVHPNISTTTNEKTDLSSWLMTYEPYEPVTASPVNSLPQNQSERKKEKKKERNKRKNEKKKKTKKERMKESKKHNKACKLSGHQE